MNGNTVTVLRAGQVVSVSEAELHNGDLVLLQAGDLVPADLRLIEATGLEVDEWELTGEIVPVEKRIGEEDVFIYQGSRVARGHGKGVVVATGQVTEYGESLKQLGEQTVRKHPALIRARYLILAVLLLPPCVVALRQYHQPAQVCLVAGLAALLVVLLQNGPLFKYLLTSVVATDLERRKIHIRDVTALGIMGDVGIVCLDKTGVLTTREIVVKHVHFADGTPDMAWFSSGDKVAALTGIACALCNDVIHLARLAQANPVDRALIHFAAQNGYNIEDLVRRYRRISDKPFDTEARYMAAGFERGDEKLYFVKGDPEVIVRMCRDYLAATGEEKRFDSPFHSFVSTKINAVTQEGDVVMALAYSHGTSETPPLQYTFLCLIAMENPLRPGVPETVEKLKRSGVRTIMLTGDRPETAAGVGRRARLAAHPEYHLTGKQIAGMRFADVALQTTYVSIFSRLLPSQKGVLVRLLQRSDLVAMVGDGLNDTIALRAADVGISFAENSSPIARRVAKVLINDITDLLPLIQSARSIRRWGAFLTLLRLALTLAMFVGLYSWILRWL